MAKSSTLRHLCTKFKYRHWVSRKTA